jgi:hypothetical protein
VVDEAFDPTWDLGAPKQKMRSSLDCTEIGSQRIQRPLQPADVVAHIVPVIHFRLTKEKPPEGGFEIRLR